MSWLRFSRISGKSQPDCKDQDTRSPQKSSDTERGFALARLNAVLKQKLRTYFPQLFSFGVAHSSILSISSQLSQNLFLVDPILDTVWQIRRINLTLALKRLTQWTITIKTYEFVRNWPRRVGRPKSLYVSHFSVII